MMEFARVVSVVHHRVRADFPAKNFVCLLFRLRSSSKVLRWARVCKYTLATSILTLKQMFHRSADSTVFGFHIPHWSNVCKRPLERTVSFYPVKLIRESRHDLLGIQLRMNLVERLRRSLQNTVSIHPMAD